MISTPATTYAALEQLRADLRASSRLSETVENSLLDQMDVLWWAMSDEERREADMRIVVPQLLGSGNQGGTDDWTYRIVRGDSGTIADTTRPTSMSFGFAKNVETGHPARVQQASTSMSGSIQLSLNTRDFEEAA